MQDTAHILIATIPTNPSNQKLSDFKNKIKNYLADINPDKKLLHILCVISPQEEALEFTKELTEFLSKAKVTRALAINTTPIMESPYRKVVTLPDKIQHGRKIAQTPITTTLANKMKIILDSGTGVYDAFILLPLSDIPEGNIQDMINRNKASFQIMAQEETYESVPR